MKTIIRNVEKRLEADMVQMLVETRNENDRMTVVKIFQYLLRETKRIAKDMDIKEKKPRIDSTKG
jgi:hypothetical protein